MATRWLENSCCCEERAVSCVLELAVRSLMTLTSFVWDLHSASALSMICALPASAVVEHRVQTCCYLAGTVL